MISSLFLRQHLLADCLASVVVGYGVFRFFARPAIRNAQSAGLNISTGDWQSLALRFGYSYFAPIAAGLLLFEIGLRFNPVLPTN
jgi:hypothetical protein